MSHRPPPSVRAVPTRLLPPWVWCRFPYSSQSSRSASRLRGPTGRQTQVRTRGFTEGRRLTGGLRIRAVLLGGCFSLLSCQPFAHLTLKQLTFTVTCQQMVHLILQKQHQESSGGYFLDSTLSPLSCSVRNGIICLEQNGVLTMLNFTLTL